MQIFVEVARSLIWKIGSKTITLEVEPSDLISDVNAKIEKKLKTLFLHRVVSLLGGAHVGAGRLGEFTYLELQETYSNKFLDENKSLEFYNVTKDATLQLVVRWYTANKNCTHCANQTVTSCMGQSVAPPQGLTSDQSAAPPQGSIIAQSATPTQSATTPHGSTAAQSATPPQGSTAAQSATPHQESTAAQSATPPQGSTTAQSATALWAQSHFGAQESIATHSMASCVVTKSPVAADDESSSAGICIRCPVCLDGLPVISSTGRSLMSTVCGHIFCSRCIPASIRSNGRCPTCRRILFFPYHVHPIFI